MNRVTQWIAAGVAALFVFSATASMQAPKTDEDYDKLMKQVGPTFGALRKGMDSPNAARQAEQLTTLFQDVHAFWMGRNVSDATEWAKMAMTHSQNLQQALAGNNADKAAEEAKALGGMCQQCHAKYREKAADGFRIKAQ